MRPRCVLLYIPNRAEFYWSPIGLDTRVHGIRSCKEVTLAEGDNEGVTAIKVQLRLAKNNVTLIEEAACEFLMGCSIFC